MLNAGSNGLFELVLVELVVFVALAVFVIVFVVFVLAIVELAILVALIWVVFELPKFVVFPDTISEVFTGVVVLLFGVEFTTGAGALLTGCVELLADGEVLEPGCVDVLFITV